MKTYIKPETIVADMLTMETILESSIGVTDGKKLGGVVEDGTIYSKEDKGWDDWNE